jgi:hypothetical protein
MVEKIPCKQPRIRRSPHTKASKHYYPSRQPPPTFAVAAQRVSQLPQNGLSLVGPALSMGIRAPGYWPSGLEGWQAGRQAGSHLFQAESIKRNRTLYMCTDH